MIWEQESNIIVMLTNVVECGRVKAHPYWPERVDSEKRYGQFSITLIQLTQQEGVIVRQLCVQDRLSTNNFRIITQFHYAEWPDNGTPQSSRGILYLVHKTNELREKTEPAGPIVVHCSAGVGRAGTYIAIDTLLQKYNLHHQTPPSPRSPHHFYLHQKQSSHLGLQQNSSDETAIPVLDTLVKLRSQRNGMVQTFEQYKFVYKVVTEALTQNHQKTTNIYCSSPAISTNKEHKEHNYHFLRQSQTKIEFDSPSLVPLSAFN